MEIVKPHAMWVEQQRDFDCTHCGTPLTDQEERDEIGSDEQSEIKCPACGQYMRVFREVRITYRAEA